MVTEESKKNRQKRDTDIIVKTLLNALPERPTAILLYGGYGRGEGAWYEDENGNTMPYNDYDVDVITDQKVTPEKRQELRKQMAKEIGIKWIDLGFISPDTIRQYQPTIQNIDLKEASTLLYGDRSVYDLFPKMEKEDIGIFDVEKLFQTRVWTFLGSWVGDFRYLDIEEARFFKNQMAKAVLASCDLLLIANKSYVTSYQERAKKACSLYPQNARLKELATWAINEKLHPSSDSLSREKMIGLYSIVKDLFCESMKIAYGKKWNYLQNPDSTKFLYYYYSTAFLRECIHKMLGHKTKIEKNIDIICAQNYAFQAWAYPGRVNSYYIMKASNILMKWGYIEKPITDWHVLRIAVSEARNNI